MFSLDILKSILLSPLNKLDQYLLGNNISEIEKKFENILEEKFLNVDKDDLEEFFLSLKKNIDKEEKNFMNIYNHFKLGEANFHNFLMCQARVKMKDYFVSKKEIGILII